MKLDLHVHCNSEDPVLVEQLLMTIREQQTVIALSGGLRYGEHDYAPNEFVLALAQREPQWVIPVARFDLWDQVDVALVDRYADAGFRALKFIYPYYEYDHDLYMPVYEAAARCGLPVLFHTGNFRPSEADVRWRRPVLRNMMPLTLDRIARSFPNLNIVMAHLGTSVWRHEAAELLKIHPNLYADLAGCGAYLSISPDVLINLLRPELPRLDRDCSIFRKLVYGSDAYVTHPHLIGQAQTAYLQMIRTIGLSQDIIDDIMGGTVAKWLNLTLSSK